MAAVVVVINSSSSSSSNNNSSRFISLFIYLFMSSPWSQDMQEINMYLV